MRVIVYAALIAAAASSITTPVTAKTATAKISESAQIVPGNSVSAYLVRGDIVTVVSDDAVASRPSAFGVPVLRIGLERQPSWFLVKRVNWDRARHKLTIDF